MSEEENIIDVTEASFTVDVIEQSSEIPVVVDFWAPWCAPCRTIGPMLERLANEPDAHFILAKVNVDENPALAIRYGIRGIPSVKAFLHGEIVNEFTGVKPEPILRQFLQSIAPSEDDFMLNDGLTLLATHHWSDAEDAFREVLELYPNDSKAMLGLAKSLLSQGVGSESLQLLTQCRDGKELISAELLRPLARFLHDYSESDLDDDTLPATELQYRNAARLLARGNFEAAMDGLLEILRQDRRFRKGEPRKLLLAIFDLLGNDDQLTQTYRGELASVLF